MWLDSFKLVAYGTRGQFRIGEGSVSLSHSQATDTVENRYDHVLSVFCFHFDRNSPKNSLKINTFSRNIS